MVRTTAPLLLQPFNVPQQQIAREEGNQHRAASFILQQQEELSKHRACLPPSLLQQQREASKPRAFILALLLKRSAAAGIPAAFLLQPQPADHILQQQNFCCHPLPAAASTASSWQQSKSAPPPPRQHHCCLSCINAGQNMFCRRFSLQDSYSLPSSCSRTPAGRSTSSSVVLPFFSCRSPPISNSKAAAPSHAFAPCSSSKAAVISLLCQKFAETNPSGCEGDISKLPISLNESIDALAKDEILINLVGEKLVSTVIGAKKADMEYHATHLDAYKQLIHQF